MPTLNLTKWEANYLWNTLYYNELHNPEARGTGHIKQMEIMTRKLRGII
jgi:hypothetical protein